MHFLIILLPDSHLHYHIGHQDIQDLTNDYGDALKKELKRKEGNSWDV